MTHHIVVLGGGYAGLGAAHRLAQLVDQTTTRITLVNERDRFVERMRLHQLAAGQPLPERSLTWILRGADVRVVVGTAVRLDTQARAVSTSDGDQIFYDTLVYALGSSTDTGIDGADAHALTVGDLASAQVLHHRSKAIANGGRLTVVGGGLTGLETATELAEVYQGLQVRILTRGTFSHWLSPMGERYLRRSLDRMRVELVEGVRVREVKVGEIVTTEGVVRTDETLWAAGFRVPSLAADAGIAVDDRGRMLVDATLRSLSHREVYAVGDAAAATTTPGGENSRMSCQTALPMGIQAAGIIAARLAGRRPKESRVRYVWIPLSLGRHDGITQFSHADDSPRRIAMTGLPAAWFKEQIFRGTITMLRRPGIVPSLPAPFALN